MKMKMQLTFAISYPAEKSRITTHLRYDCYVSTRQHSTNHCLYGATKVSLKDSRGNWHVVFVPQSLRFEHARVRKLEVDIN